MWILAQTPPPATAQAPPPARARPTGAADQDATQLSGVEVTAVVGVPKVVATYPAAGAAVAPGNLALMVRFDHRMSPGSWSYGAGDTMPACLETPRLLKDEKTFVLLCTVGFNKRFTVQMNGGGQDNGFVDVARKTADPFTLAFTTTGADPVLTVDDALKAAGLAATDDPIVNSDPRGGG